MLQRTNQDDDARQQLRDRIELLDEMLEELQHATAVLHRLKDIHDTLKGYEN